MFYQEGNKLFRRYDGELLCIEACGENALRVRATMLGRFKEDKISALLPDIKPTAAAIEIMKRVRNACQGRDTMNSPEGGVRMNEMSIMAADAANGINLRIDLPSIRIE